MKLTTVTTAEDHAAVAAVTARVIGWSDERQYYFFKALLDSRPDLADLLMVGVYHGRDLAFIGEILRLHHPGRVLRIIAVDRFSSAPCADWPAWATSWEHLTNGMPPPNLEAARRNNEANPAQVTLVQADDADFLAVTGAKYDAIYLDAAHDKESLKRQLRQVVALCRSEASVIAGDDFSNLNGWGVQSAVEEGCRQFWLFREWIWFTAKAHLQP